MVPKGQAGFRPNCCILDQVALFTEDIEASFNKKLKAGAVPVTFSAAYDTLYHRGLTLKLLKTIPSKEMIRGIMGMILHRHFHVHIEKSKSCCQTLLHGVSLGSVIAPALFNLYTYDMLTTVLRKYIYADDIAVMASDKCFTVVE